MNLRRALYRRCIDADYVRHVLPLTIAIATLLGCVFAASCAAKLRNRRSYTEFQESLRASRLIAPRAVAPVAATLAGGEALVALALLGCAAYIGTRGEAAPDRQAVTAPLPSPASAAMALLAAAAGAVGSLLIVFWDDLAELWP